jgi:hypothetical protein
MPYVLRAADGTLLSLHREAAPGAEHLPSDHPEVLAFLGTEEQHRFASLDANLVRVLEDLVDVLITRNVICITDLPSEAQQKLFERKHFRERAGRNALQLFDTTLDDGGIAASSGSRYSDPAGY